LRLGVTKTLANDNRALIITRKSPTVWFTSK
jgi:hypothetical protein